MGGTSIAPQSYAATSGSLELTFGQYGGTNPTGIDPVSLLLRLLTSTGTPLANGSYDKYREGIGLGIPQDQIDFTSFSAITGAKDWDANAQLFFRIAEPEPAKDFIDNEICRPFGLYVTTGNDGKIRCIRPRNPQMFYIGEGNRYLTVAPTTSGSYTVTLDVGVYTAEQLCVRIQFALEKINFMGYCHHWTCTWNPTTHKFKLTLETKISVGDTCTTTVADTFDILVGGSATNGWNTLGWTSTVPDAPDWLGSESQVAVGTFTTTNVLGKDDMWAVRMIDNQSDRITSVTYSFDYDHRKDAFLTTRTYTDSEYAGLDDIYGPREYQIQSRGLASGGQNSKSWAAGYKQPASGCTPTRVYPILASGVNGDTWAKVHAETLLDRYKQPPIKFRAKLKWKWNHLEVGDLVRVTYDIRGVLVDHERNKDWIDNRIFEVVELHPNFDGSLDATFLGFRYVSY